MPVLVISDSDVMKTARLDPADATNIADASFVVAQEQASIEAGLQATALSDLTVRPLILRGVIKLLAAELLDMQSREEGASGTFQGAGVTIGRPLDHAVRLREEARLALGPYLLAGGVKDPLMVSPTVPPSSLALQDRLFGRTEGDRRGGDFD
jgi:hypothetical protein